MTHMEEWDDWADRLDSALSAVPLDERPEIIEQFRVEAFHIEMRQAEETARKRKEMNHG